jgi:nucleotide-binding universal stress UspA family protein
MPRIYHILFPVDFSEQSKAIRPFVKAMAAKFGAKVTLLHVLEIPATFYPALDTAYVIDFDVDAMRQEASEKLAAFYGEPAELAIETGEPAHVIVAYAANHDVDLIMVATHGYGKYRSLLLGSVAAKVLHDARVPVWTAAHTEDPQLQNCTNVKSMLVGIDLKEGSAELLEKAAKFAARCSANLRLVHAVPGAGEDGLYLGATTDKDFPHFLLNAAREEAARVQQTVGTKLEQCVAGGQVSHVVREAAKHHEAGLVIIGRGKLEATLGRLRTHAYSIIRDSPCPVLSL